MASFNEHLKKAKENLTFLEIVCNNVSHFWDWKVTISFYSAVHIIKAYIARKANQHYRSHEQVASAINPNTQMSVCKLGEKEYLAYAKLRNLSRRSRYLVSDQNGNVDSKAFFIYDKHFAKAIRHLDKLVTFINSEYSEDIETTKVICVELKKEELVNFILP